MGHRHVWTAPGSVIWVPIRLAFSMHADGVVARRILRVKLGLYHPDHAVFLEERTESGRPAPSMRLRTATPMATSVR